MAPLTEDRSFPELHICPECASHLVYPVSWEASESVWEMWLRCPECEHWRSGTFSRESVERFERELERGDDEMVGALSDLTRRNMEEDIAMIGRALSSDALLPEDF